MKEARGLWLPWWGALCVIAGSFAVGWFFDQWGELDLAQPFLIFVASFCLLIFIKRKVMGRPWFLITLAVFAVLHLPLIAFIVWPHQWIPAQSWAGISTLDFVAMLAILSIVESRVEGRKS